MFYTIKVLMFYNIKVLMFYNIKVGFMGVKII